MTTKVVYETECDICGDELHKSTTMMIPGQVSPAPERFQGSYHFKFDACAECEAEMLAAKATLIDVMRMKRGNETPEAREKRHAELRAAAQWLNSPIQAGQPGTPYQHQQYGTSLSVASPNIGASLGGGSATTLEQMKQADTARILNAAFASVK